MIVQGLQSVEISCKFIFYVISYKTSTVKFTETCYMLRINFVYGCFSYVLQKVKSLEIWKGKTAMSWFRKWLMFWKFLWFTSVSDLGGNDITSQLKYIRKITKIDTELIFLTNISSIMAVVNQNLLVIHSACCSQ